MNLNPSDWLIFFERLVTWIEALSSTIIFSTSFAQTKPSLYFCIIVKKIQKSMLSVVPPCSIQIHWPLLIRPNIIVVLPVHISFIIGCLSPIGSQDWFVLSPLPKLDSSILIINAPSLIFLSILAE